MKKRSFRKNLCCSVVAILSLFAVCGNNLHAADITYDPGIANAIATGLPQTQTVVAGSTVTFTNMGGNASDYVMIGWSTMKMPFVTTLAMENMVRTLSNPGFTYYAIGGTYTIADDMTLYAVWAVDKNNDGKPDYSAKIIKPKLSKEKYERIMSDLKDEMAAEDNGVSLRSLPAWNNNFDLTAFNDSVYYVGCTYKPEYENLIYFNPLYCFQGLNAYIDTTMYFVIEYGGVLEEKSMIGGKAQRALDSIKITPAMVGMDVDDLFANYPFRFNAIKEDGQGILKMYFVKSDGTHPTIGTVPGSNIRLGLGGTWTKPFGLVGSSVSGDSDTLTIEFNIYNKPEFESATISQRVDTAGYIDLKHVSGTPLKYMMRCINEFRWRPADAPLSNAEKGEIWNGASICLREFDRSIGYQQVEILYFQSDEFSDPIKNPNYVIYLSDLDGYYLDHNCDSIWSNYFMTDPTWWSMPGGIKDTYDGLMAISGMTHQIAIQMCIPIFEGLITATDTHSANAIAQANSTAIAMMPAYGQYLATKVYVPASCRGTFCFDFGSKATPVITRAVYIPQVQGVITDPGYGAHYIESQSDFHFTAKYTTEKPLKVTTNRVIGGLTEELSGTLNEKGVYEYMIPQVTQNIELKFGPETVANASIMDGSSVWSYNNTIYIHVEKADIASIYSIAGQMVKRIELSSEGDNPVPTERGVYIVTLKNGSVHKVVVK